MPKPITALPTGFAAVLLICRKCGKKLDGGFGPERDDTLARALKRTLRETGQRRSVRIVETKCLGLCPKNAVTVLPATQPDRILTVPAGTDPAELMASLQPL
jgi:predicted metal-binding protein